MGVDKVILRAFLSTLAAIALLFVFMFSALIFIYPSTMMEITYDLGMDSASISFAETAYDRSEEVYYIAYATEVAIGIDDYQEIELCGERFIADENFAEYCNAKELPAEVDMTYEQYIYGQVCVSKYNLGKKEAAVQRSIELVGNSFPKNNAMVAMLITVMNDADSALKDKLVTRMTEIQTQSEAFGLSETDATYLANILSVATK